MWISILKVAYLRIKFAYFPNKAQKFWGQELLNSQGITAKIGQILGQGKGIDPPKSTITPQKLQHLFFKTFEANIDVTEEVYAASIGQVFFVAINGNKYALKILHPGHLWIQTNLASTLLKTSGCQSRTSRHTWPRGMGNSLVTG